MKVIVNQPLSIDTGMPSVSTEAVVLMIPRRSSRNWCLKNMNILKTLGPIIEVFLVAELSVFGYRLAPLNVAFGPPVQHRQAYVIAFKNHQTNVVFTVGVWVFMPIHARLKSVLVNHNRRVTYFIEDRLWI